VKRFAALGALLLAAGLALAPAGCSGSRRPAAPPDVAPPGSGPPAESAAPAAPPTEAPVEPVPAPPEVVAPAPPPRFPDTVRIGLETDLDSFQVPCCEVEATIAMGGERYALTSPLVVRPAARADSPTVWRLQASAIRDRRPAEELAARLGRRTGEPADAKFDARSGLFRIRVGAWPSRAEAETASRRLRSAGLESAWVVSEGGGISAPALDLTSRGATRRVAVRRLLVEPVGGSGLRVGASRYRGALEIFLNDRGRLNLVNVLSIEDYLRGVVPRELGPGQYPELEALKAQAVAARSYTLRNLGGFTDEGYDLCGTPQCQVYGGMGAEHPLSDRAVEETRGEVLLSDGEPLPADALYSATCGGHTENVETVFPLRSASYLRGVPCIESGPTRLAGAGGRWPQTVLAAIDPALGSGGLDRPSAIGDALSRLTARAGIAAPRDHLRSLERSEVRRYLASMLDLAVDARLFRDPSDVEALVAERGPATRPRERAFGSWLLEHGVLSSGGAALSAVDARELLFRVAVLLGLAELHEGGFLEVRDGTVLVGLDEGEAGFPFGSGVATFGSSGGVESAEALDLVPGDPVDLVAIANRLVAVVARTEPRRPGYDHSHDRARWSRFRSDRELAGLVAARYPGFRLRDFQVLDRGVSDRVGRLRLTAQDGESVDLEGLAIRWTFDLPDTRFTARRATATDGSAGWRFVGSGWGHGVGMCQTGAFGMARRGLDYRTILRHYYRGVRIASVVGSGDATGRGVAAAP